MHRASWTICHKTRQRRVERHGRLHSRVGIGGGGDVQLGLVVKERHDVGRLSGGERSPNVGVGSCDGGRFV